MTNQTEKTQIVPVVLRVWKGGRGVLALFPTIPHDRQGYFCSSFEHVGQHSKANYCGCIQNTRPATIEEGAPLVRELEGIGYRLQVVQRASATMHKNREIDKRK